MIAPSVLDDFWSSGPVGFRNAVQNQQERKVSMLVWFYRKDCAECIAVENSRNPYRRRSILAAPLTIYAR